MGNKKDLEQVICLDEIIKASKEELLTLQELAKSVRVTTYDGNKGSNGKNKGEANFTKIIDKMLDLENQINEEILVMVDTLDKLHKDINMLQNNNEKLVLRFRYLSNLTWQEIADKMGYSVMQIHRIHKKALDNYREI
ncbi:MAG: sigma factor-like helix-turn-helix DNA-binding protein [Lachnospirales bacterium]